MASFIDTLRRGFWGFGHMFTKDAHRERMEGFKSVVSKDINRLATGVGNVAGNVLSGVGQGIVGPLGDMLFKLGESQRAYDKQERELEYLRSLPITQMQNLADAGLNPNLIYGNGAAGAAGNYTPNEDKGFGVDALGVINGTLGQIMSTIGAFQNIKAVSAGIDKTREAVRTAALKNDLQEYMNFIYGIYDPIFDKDSKDHNYVVGGRLRRPLSYFNVGTGEMATGEKGFLGAKLMNQFREMYNKGRLSQAEYESFEKQLQTLISLQEAQTGNLNTQSAYTQEQLNRLLKTWDPNTLRLLDLGESLAGDATTLLTRGIAGKHGMFGQLHDEYGYKQSPKGYYSYGRQFR